MYNGHIIRKVKAIQATEEEEQQRKSISTLKYIKRRNYYAQQFRLRQNHDRCSPDDNYFKDYTDLEEFHIFKQRNKRAQYKSVAPKEKKSIERLCKVSTNLQKSIDNSPRINSKINIQIDNLNETPIAIKKMKMITIPKNSK